MNRSRSRKKKYFLIIVALIILAVVAILLVRGCVEKRRENLQELREDISTTRGRQPSQQQPAAGGGSQGGGQAGGQAAGGEGEEPPQEAPPAGEQAPAATLEIAELSITPFEVRSGRPIAWYAGIRGDAASVSMVATNRANGASISASLREGPTINGVTNWSYDGTAPSTPGEYDYSATATAADGSSVDGTGSYIRVIP